MMLKNGQTLKILQCEHRKIFKDIGHFSTYVMNESPYGRFFNKKMSLKNPKTLRKC